MIHPFHCCLGRFGLYSSSDRTNRQGHDASTQHQRGSRDSTLALGAIWGVRKPAIRDALGNTIKAALNRQILLVVLFLTAYTVGVVAILRAVHFWTPALAKDTVVWFCIVGLPLGSDAIRNYSHPNTRTLLLKTIGLGAAVEFISNFFTFPLVIELVWISLLVFLGAAIGIAELRDEARPAEALKHLVTFLGSLVAIWIIHRMITDGGELLDPDNLRLLALPIPLGLAYLPAAFLLAVFSAYQHLFNTVDVGSDKTRRVKFYMKRRLFFHLGLDPEKVQLFLRTHAVDLLNFQSRDDVLKIIGQV